MTPTAAEIVEMRVRPLMTFKVGDRYEPWKEAMLGSLAREVDGHLARMAKSLGVERNYRLIYELGAVYRAPKPYLEVASERLADEIDRLIMKQFFDPKFGQPHH